MAKIQILDAHVANQIAAGEVVERPASIVKELVENAIDAEATRIVVQLEEGGISKISVSDNGIGMEPEDAKLAFARHATSKIKRERDLLTIRTLGFRGEALPSIASVSRVKLTTCHDPDQLAYSIQLEGGVFKKSEEVSRSRGTDVVVTDLFYNTPARLKYLKTVNTEVGHIADLMGRIALAHPEIAFSLRHQQRELFRTTGDGKIRHVLYALYGKQVASKMIPIQIEDADFSVTGFFSKPEITRASRSYITLIINGRYVRSIPLTQAIMQAYATLLPTGRYPIGVLQIEMDPRLLDVNVHPAKYEVRLSKEKECCDLIRTGIRQALQKEVLVPQVTRKDLRPSINREKPKQQQLVLESPLYESEKQYTPKPLNRQALVLTEQLISPPNEEPPVENSSKPKEESSQPQTVEAPKSESQPPASSKPIDAEASRFPQMVPLAQIHGTYIVAQTEDGFYLVDQHAAHERIYYEKFFQQMDQTTHRQQMLLFPLTVECSPSEAKILESYQEELRDWGMEIEPFGGTTWLVRSHPPWFPKDNELDTIRELIDWLKEHGKVETALFRDAAAKMMACKAAIKANRHLRRDEMEQLFRDLNNCENPFTCPHGRPIFIHFSTYELEKMFKRVM
jgi:DNA mismatch repair protein MutL